ncbi:MAG: Hpt domain-containing protein, partial [Sulfuricella sp.]
MSHFAGMEELLQDFLTEAGELLSDVDNKLVELEKRPDDKALLNDIFRGFHTIKGGAGFLNVNDLVELCHRTENLFDKLRTSELTLTPSIMDVIMLATGVVRTMFGSLSQAQLPDPADPALLKALDAVLAGQQAEFAALAAQKTETPSAQVEQPIANESSGPDWPALYQGITGAPSETSTVAQETVLAPEIAPAPFIAPLEMAPRAKAQPPAQQPAAQEPTLRGDTARLDMVL